MTSMLFRIAAPLVLAAAAGVAGFYHGHQYATAKGQAELAEYRAEAARKLAALHDQARATEATWSAKLQESQDAARQREARLRADIDRLRTESVRLRDSVATASVRLRLPDAAPAAITEYASTTGELLLECTEAYRELAAAADGHAADAMMLHQAWPR